jgi:hypothetical protein
MELEKLEVIHRRIALNLDYQDYPLANKPLVAGYAEQTIDAEILVFADSDKVILNDPTEFVLNGGYDGAVRPVDKKNIGTQGRGTPNFEYWNELFTLTGVCPRSTVQTVVDRTRVLAYWNSGLVVVKRAAGIFTSWRDLFERVMHLKLQPDTGPFYVEQSALAAALCASNACVQTLSRAYSYPLHLHNEIPEEQRPVRLDHLVSLHYHRAFDGGHWRNSLADFAGTGDRYRWLVTQLADLDF